MLTRILAATAFCCLTLPFFTPTAAGQTLYGNDGSTQTLWEFTTTPGAPCSQPNPVALSCNFNVPLCGGPGPMTVTAPPTGFLGDVAVNCATDTVYVTDGFIIEEYVGDPACGLPAGCSALDQFRLPLSLVLAGMGPMTGMGMDELGTWTAGQPVLYVTDGKMLAGISIPTLPCGSPTVLFGPCILTNPFGVPYTDLSWDPLSATLWACDVGGNVQQISSSCAILTTFDATALCSGIGPVLQGIAFDLGSGRTLSPGAPAVYVTDGFTVAYVRTDGLPASPTFYTPVPCTPTPAPLNGLALASHSISYGAPRFTAECGTYGQSCAPSSNFGLEYNGVPQGLLVVLLLNTSFPGPGYFCPSVYGLGTNIWVDPSPPGFVLVLGLSTPVCTPLPLPIPATAPTGVNVFFQFLFVDPTTLLAVDATEGCSFTITAP